MDMTILLGPGGVGILGPIGNRIIKDAAEPRQFPIGEVAILVGGSGSRPRCT
jgi:hypothetical protein